MNFQYAQRPRENASYRLTTTSHSVCLDVLVYSLHDATMSPPNLPPPEEVTDALNTPSLDPQTPSEWAALRTQGHQMLEDLFDYLETIRQRPVWQPAPPETQALFKTGFPVDGGSLSTAYQIFSQHILPYTVGNVHPGFMGWVHGGGTPVGMLAEMLAGGLNVNVGGRNQIPVQVEAQVIDWVRAMAGFPKGAGGLLVTGSSMANLMALLVARCEALGTEVRHKGLRDASFPSLVAYASSAAHGCITQAMEISGIGGQALRLIPVDDEQQLDLTALRAQIAEDKAAGFQPFLLVGTAGTVNTGTIDDLSALADLAHEEDLWFHVDGAFGALARLSPTLAPQLAGLEQADSLAMDFHKWGQVPYDAGCVLVRDGQKQLDTFAFPADYLRRESAGLAAGSPWPCDFGPDLSRGFRALKVWFTLQVYGQKALAETIDRCCALARHLGELIDAEPRLRRMAPVSLNIVCFSYVGHGQHLPEDQDALNRKLLIALHESGLSAPSSTVLKGRLVLRAAIVNHRTRTEDITTLLNAVLTLGAAEEQSIGRGPA